MDVLREVLEPLEAGLRRPLGGEHDRLPLLLVRRERRLGGRFLVQARGEGQGVLHRELGAGADREVGGVGGVPEDHDARLAGLGVDPALVAHRRERDPARVVGHHGVTVEHVGEELADQGDRLLVGLTGRPLPVGEVGEARTPPDLARHLHDERRPGRVERVAMDLHHAVRRLADVELERVEDPVGAQPDVAAVAHVEARPEGVGVPTADAGVQAVGGHDQVVRRSELVDVGRLGPEVQRHVELAASLVEDLQEPAAAHRGEPMAAAGDDLSLEVDVDVVPDRELALHLREDHRVGVLDAAERLVAEHHAEPEGVVRGVPLPDRDLVLLSGGRGQLLGEGREVETAGAASDHRDPHLPSDPTG